MATLNTSTNGPSIAKSYQSVIGAPRPSGPVASSPTYGQWAVFAVSAPLANAFQQDAGGKESVLKVQSTGEGELVDLIDEFSDGRIQFAYVKVKDSNSGLPKNALIAWCGEGVPERTKGYFGSHLGTVAKLLHGYHVQITARSDRDLTPEGIVQKVADASGSKYSAGDTPPPIAAATKPTTASKPAFTPTQSSRGVALAGMSRGGSSSQKNPNVDADGWGEDAPPVTRTQIEKVQSAYQPTRVDMRSLTAQQPAASAFNSSRGDDDDRPGAIKGAYQPVGKVDIAETRRRAQASGPSRDDRPEIVKGSYEPVGKVDIAAIRAKAQKPGDSPAAPAGPADEPTSDDTSGEAKSLAERSAAFAQPERLTSLPKPKVANKFGGSSFTGTKAPLLGGFEAKPLATAAPVGAASKTFADEGGKTPAQIWAEKKARERGLSGAADLPVRPGQSPLTSQTSGGGGEWKSSYSGKSWAPVATNQTGKSAGTNEEPAQEEEEEEVPSSGGIKAMRDRFSGAPPMGQPASSAGFDRAAPEPDTSNKPNKGMPLPPPQPPRPDEEEEEEEEEDEPRSTSPIRVAIPVARGKEAEVADAREEQMSPPPAMPIRSLGRVASAEEGEDEPETGPDPGRTAAQTQAMASLGHEAVHSAPAASAGGERAKAEYDYEAAEDNEVSLREGEIVTDIEKIDPDWWVVTNEAGQKGLVPANYLVALDEEEAAEAHHAGQLSAATEAAEPEPAPEPEPTHVHTAAGASAGEGKTAIAQYDYEAGEPNELSFPENARITNVEFPDDDWWLGEYEGKQGLFPANFVELVE